MSILSKNNADSKLNYSLLSDIISVVDNNNINESNTSSATNKNKNNNNNNNDNDDNENNSQIDDFLNDSLPDTIPNLSMNFLKTQVSRKLSKGGLAFSFGKCDQGKLGHGDALLNRQIPTLIESLIGASITKVVSISSNVIAIDEEGMVYIWG